MDQELISYLDTRFQAIEGRFEAMEGRFQALEERMEGRFQALEERMEERFKAVEESIRHTDIKVEALRDEIHLVADGVAAVDQKLDKLKSQIQASNEQLERRVTRLEQRAKFL
jgi:chromosome segregation ATPase